MAAATAQTAHDKNGSELFVGDEGLLRFKITDVREGSVLTTSFESPHREYWFQGSLIERVAQGGASIEADRKAALAPVAPTVPAAVPPAPPATEAEAPVAAVASPREQAIAFVMSHGRDRAAAEKVVEEYGTKMLLEDRDEEERSKKESAGSVSATSPGFVADQASPAPGEEGKSAA